MSVVTCPGCAAKNRVPQARPGRVRCAKCHTDLPWLVDADDDSFDTVVGEATLPVLVDVWALGVIGFELLALRRPFVAKRKPYPYPYPYP